MRTQTTKTTYKLVAMKNQNAITKKITRNYNPLTSPGRFVRYGSIPYKVLSYARFRNNKSFTTTDYREFMLKKVSSERVREAVNFLSDIGYLERHDNLNPTHHQMKFQYTITMCGEHALVYLARKQREREYKTKTQNGVANSTIRWIKEKNK